MAKALASRNDTQWILKTLVLGVSVATLLPIIWMVFIAFQTPRSTISPGWNSEFTLDNFTKLLAPGQIYGPQLGYSLILVTVASTLILLVSAPGAYSLSKLGWSPKVTWAVLGSLGLLQVIPPMAFIPGLFATLNDLNLNGNIGALIVANVVFNMPFAVIMMKFYFDALPSELREAASIDGASESTIFTRIMLPMAVAGLAAVGIFIAIQVWNEFLFGLIFTTGGAKAPITVGIATLVQPQEIKFGGMAAIGTLTAIPIIILAIVANRQIVSGLTQGALKG